MPTRKFEILILPKPETIPQRTIERYVVIYGGQDGWQPVDWRQVKRGNIIRMFEPDGTPTDGGRYYIATSEYMSKHLGIDVEEHPPIPMILFCPVCGYQHVDGPRPSENWTNPPHRSHLCFSCKQIWRPSDVATTGVEEIQTSGKEDAFWTPERARPAKLDDFHRKPGKTYARDNPVPVDASHYMPLAGLGSTFFEPFIAEAFHRGPDSMWKRASYAEIIPGMILRLVSIVRDVSSHDKDIYICTQPPFKNNLGIWLIGVRRSEARMDD